MADKKPIVLDTTNNVLAQLKISGGNEDTLLVKDIKINGELILEGSTSNEFETTISVTDPTADNSIVFQDGSGTVAFLSDAPATNLSYTASTRLLESSTGTDVTLPEVVAGGNSGLITGADKTKIDAIEAGATGDQTAAEIRTLVDAASDSNVFTDADHSKLDGIEAGATGDQTAAEIRTLVDAASDSNVFTDADHSKLDGIESGATADQTAAEIRTLVDSATDSNVFTDADHTKLDGIASGAEVNVATDLSYTASTRLLASSTGSDVTLPEVVALSDSGLMTGADKSKLDGIEAAATADQTAAEIRTLVDAASDSNVFTDADHTKLDGIAAGAEVNVATNLSYTASSRELASSTGTNVTLPEVSAGGDSGLMTGADKTKLDGLQAGQGTTNLSYTASTRVIASSSGTDATLPNVTAGGDSGLMTGADKTKLDGVNADNYLKSNADDTYTGIITGNRLLLGGSALNSASAAKLQVNGFMRTGAVYVHDTTNNTDAALSNTNNVLFWNSHKVWHAGNDGSDTGLDADKLDGQHGSYFLDTSSTAQTKTGNLTISKALPKLILDSPSSGDNFTSQGAQISLGESGDGGSAALHLTYRGDGYGYIGMGVLDDGIPPYSQMRFKYNANQIITQGLFRVDLPSGADIGHNGQLNTLQVYQPTAGDDAVMTFHVSNDYAVHFGLDGGSNDLYVGGWSKGSDVRHKIWHEGNHGDSSGLDADKLDGQHGSYYTNASNLTGSPTFTSTTTTNIFFTNTDGDNPKIKAATGSYGSIKVTDWGKNDWLGYAIEQTAVFMANNTYFGLYDDTNNHWAVLHTRNGATALYYDNSSKLQTTSGGVNISGTATATNFAVSNGGTITDASGNYGSIKVTGGATGSWAGYAIENGAVFMQNTAQTAFGLYDDTNNHWAVYHTKNAETRLYYNNSNKLQTTNGGANISGTLECDKLYVNKSGEAQVDIRDSRNGGLLVRLFTRKNSNTDRDFGIYNNSANRTFFRYINNNSGQGVNNDRIFLAESGGRVGIKTTSPSKTLSVNGSFSKNSGSFEIPHVLPHMRDTHKLVHSFVEAPSASNLYAGMVQLENGTATINIDTEFTMTEGTFVALNALQSWSCSNETGWEPVRCSVNGNILTIECRDTTSTDTVYYEVRGIRQDPHMFETEWTDDNGRVIVEPLAEPEIALTNPTQTEEEPEEELESSSAPPQ